jgi:hypothetical protein
MVIAETKRLWLRELVPGDAGRMFEIYSDAATMASSPSSNPAIFPPSVSPGGTVFW